VGCNGTVGSGGDTFAYMGSMIGEFMGNEYRNIERKKLYNVIDNYKF